MELYIYNANRELIGIVESFDYFRWTRRYSLCGSFELKAIASAENAALLKKGNLIWKSDDEEVGIIESVNLVQTDRELITVSGRFATSLLSRRIIWETEVLSGDFSIGIEQFINNHLITPSDPARQISGVDFSSPIFGINVLTQISYRNLMDAVTSLCDAFDIGIKTIFHQATGSFTVTLYQGVISQAVFSKEYESLTEQVYSESEMDYANTALIGGEGEGIDRVFATIISGSGEARREIFVDAKDLQEAEFGVDYTNALLFRGQSKLNESAIQSSFDATINPHGNLIYKNDFNLGDLVKVESKAWGVLLTTRITEIQETYDGTGRSLDVTFGKGVLTLMQKLKGVM